MQQIIFFRSKSPWKELHALGNVCCILFLVMSVAPVIRGHYAAACGLIVLFALMLVGLHWLGKRIGGEIEAPGLLICDTEIKEVSSTREMKWSDVKRVSWPVTYGESIQLWSTTNKIALASDMISIKPSKVRVGQRATLFEFIRQRTSGSPHKLWKKFCLENAIYELTDLEDESDIRFKSAFSRFPSLRTHFLQCRLKKAASSNDVDARSLFRATVNPTLFFSLAATIAFSSIWNNWLITGELYGPIVKICLFFSAALATLALLSVFFGRNTIQPEKSEFRHFVLIWILAYLILAPTLFYLFTQLGAAGKYPSMALLFGGYAPAIVLVAHQAGERKKVIEKHGRQAVRFWENYHSAQQLPTL